MRDTKQILGQAVEVLESLYGTAFLPEEIFTPIAKVVTLSTAELVPLVETKDGLSVVFVRRPKDDKYWPNLWHIPGQIIRSSDRPGFLGDFDNALARVLNDELNGQELLIKPQECGRAFATNVRGNEIRFWYWALLADVPQGLLTIPVTQLDTKESSLFVPDQEALIASAMQAYAVFSA